MTQGSRILVRLAAVAVAIIIVFSLRRKPAAPAPAADTTAAQPVAAMDATPHARIFATVGDSGSRIEGLAEHQGKLYTAGYGLAICEYGIRGRSKSASGNIDISLAWRVFGNVDIRRETSYQVQIGNRAFFVYTGSMDPNILIRLLTEIQSL